MCRHLTLFLATVLALALPTLATRASDPAADRAYAAVAIAPTRTSIYVGTISMSFGPFSRVGGAYTATYRAKVFPFFFYNESGRLTVSFDDEQLRRLHRGEPVEFEGFGINESGARRRVAGKAVPTSLQSGRITVDVYVTRTVKLVFHTTYAFPAPPAP